MDTQTAYRLEFFFSEHPSVTELAIRGEIDVSEASRLDAALDRALSEPTHRTIVNLIGTTYIDSTCIHSLIRAIKKAKQEGKSLDLIISKGSGLEKIFDVTGLGRVFRLFYSLKEALSVSTE